VADCVEVRRVGGVVAVRDSKDARGLVLYYTLPEWEAFVSGIKNGEFDHIGGTE
jgi:hypothetical protein